MAKFKVGDEVIADDGQGFRYEDGVVEEVVEEADGAFPYHVRSKNAELAGHMSIWPFEEDELTARS